MTKDEIIAKQSRLILDLMRIGQDKIQEALDLFCEIEIMPRDKVIERIYSNNMVELKPHNKKELGLCHKCKINLRNKFKSGIISTYCKSCTSSMAKDRRAKRIMGSR
jgi:transposase